MITTHRPDSDSIVLKVDAARIDASVAMSFKDEVREILTDTPRRVILDLAEVEFLDSSGLGALVAVMKMLEDGCRLELANCGAVVRRVLTLTRMDRVFLLHNAPLIPVAARSKSGQDAA